MPADVGIVTIGGLGWRHHRRGTLRYDAARLLRANGSGVRKPL